MRLIDADKLSETIQDSINLMESKGVDCITARWVEIIADNAPTEEAVPLKPLARWLAGYAFPPELKAQKIVANRGRDIHQIAAEGWEDFLRGMDWRADDADD